MKESFLRNRKFQFVINLLTTLSFALFTAFQIFLVFQIESARVGRMIGVGIFLILTVASVFNFFEKSSLWNVHFVLLLIALFLLFGVRMLNIYPLFSNLNFANLPSVLNCAVFIFSQVGTLFLAAGYVISITKINKKVRRVLTIILMSAVILLYVACFVIECVLLIKYHRNIEYSLVLTLLSRVAYLGGFVGTAFSFMLPVPQKKKKDQGPGKFVYSRRNNEVVDLVM